MDFTIEKYKALLGALHKHKEYSIRHDVDLRPDYALQVARVEAEMGMTATYYFRSMHFDSHANTIMDIAAMGHRAGYHYECLTSCNGDMGKAYDNFCRNLERLRAIVPVSAACAHGSPRSPWNSQDIWTQHDIHTLGIEHESMLDTDFSKTLYLTDTGRRWDGYKVSVRDKVPEYQEQWQRERLVFHTTDDIIHALNTPDHPIHTKSLLINTHPQRWMPFGFDWMKEFALQNIKNIIKKLLVISQYYPTHS